MTAPVQSLTRALMFTEIRHQRGRDAGMGLGARRLRGRQPQRRRHRQPAHAGAVL